ncbi:MAG: AAA family ATPase, partial [Deltaproteobacteria bacterium]|nr:AAA family ATPase [Deltaproteobacteria bacterium]
MNNGMPSVLKQVLTEKLADSLTEPPADFTPRSVFGETGLSGKATAVIGVRRAGKTTFLHQLRQERLRQGAKRDQLPYINFEDERLADLTANQLGYLLDKHGRRCPEAYDSESVTWYLDEIQVVPGWERFVRRLLD